MTNETARIYVSLADQVAAVEEASDTFAQLAAFEEVAKFHEYQRIAQKLNLAANTLRRFARVEHQVRLLVDVTMGPEPSESLACPLPDCGYRWPFPADCDAGAGCPMKPMQRLQVQDNEPADTLGDLCG